jgi:hypothetical protein
MRQAETAVRAELEAERRAWGIAAEQQAAEAAAARERIAALEQTVDDGLAAIAQKHSALAVAAESAAVLVKESVANKVLADAVQAELEREQVEHAARLAEADKAAESAQQDAEALRAELEAERRAWEDAAAATAAEIGLLRQRVASLEQEAADARSTDGAVVTIAFDLVRAVRRRWQQR